MFTSNFPAHAAARHQRYVIGWVLGETSNRDSDFLLTLFSFFTGKGLKVQKFVRDFRPEALLTRCGSETMQYI